jgi:hypothetical protein
LSDIVVAFEPASRARARQRGRPAPSEVYPARVARQLALAYALQERIQSGEFGNQAALARGLGFSRERISKIMDLLNLAPDIQEEILFLECAPGGQPAAEADLHKLVLKTTVWEEQRACWASLQVGVSVPMPPPHTDVAAANARAQ